MRHAARSLFLAIVLMVAGTLPSAFAVPEILVFYRSTIPLYEEIARHLEQKAPSTILPCPLETLSVSFLESRSPTAVITLGEAGLKRALILVKAIPIIATLTDGQTSDQRVRFLSTDQPVDRQIMTLRTLLPALQRVWIPSTDPRYAPSSEMMPPAASGTILLNHRLLHKPRDLPEALRLLPPGTSAIILSPDPGLMNDATLQSIFLTSFEKRIPVVGFSENLIRKGAAFAYVLSPEDLAAELLAFATTVIDQQVGGHRRFNGWRLVLNRTILQKLGLPVPSALSRAAAKIF